MQFYRDGYRPGDPDVLPASPQALVRSTDFPGTIDVLIVGAGPAGTVLGAQLAVFPEIETRVIERRQVPLEVGHADGVACRTVEMLQSFGLAEALLREAYWVNEVRFWGPSDTDRSRIERKGRVDDTPEGLSEFPHVIVNQARMEDYLLQFMQDSASKLSPDYGIQFVRSVVGEEEYPVEVTLRRNGGERTGEEFTIRAKYVVGCDGARSAVRQTIGLEPRGDAANHAWGIIDVLATTDFPDWRTKNVIQSAGKGSLLMIPREGGSMVRCYVDLGKVPEGDRDIRNMTAEQLTALTNSILYPYSIDVKSVVWSSVYEVGQRLTDRFDDASDADPLRQPRVFITGDACHTHSAKAGLGMNVSMQDAFNLGWKLAAVLQGKSEASLLSTYSAERQTVAQELIDFDRYWAAFIAQPTLDPEHPERGGVTAEEMHAQFVQQGSYAAGLATVYSPSMLTGTVEHQGLASGFGIGARFHSAPVIRVADAKRMELGHTHRADGRWRIYAFGDTDGTALRDFANWLGESPSSPIRRATPAASDIDDLIDVHGVFRSDHHDVDLHGLPEVLFPRSGRLGLQDWEKAWAADPSQDIFDARGVDEAGAIVIVRPDQYVAHVLPLTARRELTEFFAAVFVSGID